jgi:4-hydroxy-4-methyl-2-oxoglutarate aldolase
MALHEFSPAVLGQYRQLSTCIVASAIETFGVRLSNTGFTNREIRSVFEDQPPIIGYAATARLRSANPPMEGRSYYERMDWWKSVLAVPVPRVVVIEDVDNPPGVGAFVGEVHANILLAFGCTGCVTNGAVRDLAQIRKTGLALFAGNVSVSHAYAHVFDFGGEVEVGGLKIRPGDLIHGDGHGIQTVPAEIVEKAPSVAAELREKRDRVIGLCRSAEFSLEKLRRVIQECEGCPEP